jgi:RNA polymerase sigma-70 factor (ECF subfamily)
MIGSVIDGEDVVQEALAKAYRSFPSLNSDANLRGWLFRIAHNQAVDFLRSTNRQPMELLDENNLVAEPDQPLEKRNSQHWLWRCFSSSRLDSEAV